MAYHYVRECHAAGITKVQKIHTDSNPADPFTKALDKNKFFANVKRVFRQQSVSGNTGLGAKRAKGSRGASPKIPPQKKHRHCD